MIPHIPNQRKLGTGGNSFGQLVAYIEENKSKEPQHLLTEKFEAILNYATAPTDKLTNEDKCIAIRTHAINELATASAEMNAVSAKNTRCKDPAYHIILSWPEHERPDPEAIFDAAAHAVRALGLADHQYIMAVHGNTDNMHCHIAVNRVHPVTFKAHHIEWAKKSLHLAARQSELKHGWTHDNGIYIVDIDGHGKKSIILNPDIGKAENIQPYAHREDEKLLPAWHDPESLESWLKKDVAKALKRDLPDLQNWHALHAWLDNKNITLTDTGGGGMRLHATSTETGEVIDLPASKGLRLLKRADLERKWGKFTTPITETPCITPATGYLTQSQLNKGAEHVLKSDLDHGTPPDHILRAYADRERRETEELAADGAGGMHELPAGSLDGQGSAAGMLLQDALHEGLGNQQTGQDQDMRRAGTGEAGSRSQRGLTRDNSKREERKAQRAAARLDLRQRFAQYKRYVREGDTEHYQRLKELRAERTEALKRIREEAKIEKNLIGKGSVSKRIIALAGIVQNTARQKLQIEADYQGKTKTLQTTRLPPLVWKEWLYEQANLGDQGALSALRGIAYQAQRDAKKNSSREEPEIDEPSDLQFRKLMARLLEEEKREQAIRAARYDAMRPYEADALLVRYAGIQWRVTGNGNVEYSEHTGKHLFTDRGNRVTFDRVVVTDNEIRMALVHAQAKFGNKLTLTGHDPVFTKRMAILADDMGMTILNPELHSVIAQNRISRQQQQVENLKTTQPDTITLAKVTKSTNDAQQQPTNGPDRPFDAVAKDEQFEGLKRAVLSIDPHAKFDIADSMDSQKTHIGPVLDIPTEEHAFVQRTGRGIYTIHASPVPSDVKSSIEIRYKDGRIATAIPAKQKDKGR